MDNVSFFIPAYNCEKTIIESINSILESNFIEGDELLIVNDCSSDNTQKIIEALQVQNSVIILINHKRNKGGAAARNTAVENAKNELLFCLDSDNILEKNSIRPLLAYLKEEKAQIACFNQLKYFETNIHSVNEIWTFNAGIYDIGDLLKGELSPGSSGNYLFTKTSWTKANGYTEDLGALDTWAFGFKQLIEGCKMVVMPDSYYYHRRGHPSYYLTDAWNKRKSVSLRLIKIIINYIDLIHPDDINYIFSKRGRCTWFDNLKKRPIRIVSDNKKSIWSEHEIKVKFYLKSYHRIKNKILRIFK